MNEAIEISRLIDKYLPADGVGTEREQIRMELHNDIAMLVKNLTIPHVSNRFSPEQMAEWFHNNYEEIAKAEGWQTQDKCKVEFKDLPESNRITMIKVCERWLNGC